MFFSESSRSDATGEMPSEMLEEVERFYWKLSKHWIQCNSSSRGAAVLISLALFLQILAVLVRFQEDAGNVGECRTFLHQGNVKCECRSAATQCH